MTEKSSAASSPEPGAMIGTAKRLVRCGVLLAQSRRLPLPIRGLLAFGLLPVPGPLDEAVLVVAVVLLAAHPGWRREVGTCWRKSC